MLLRLFLLFTIVPFVEVLILVWIGKHTSLGVTLALIFLPGLLGAWLARREGLRCWREVRRQVYGGELPAAALLDGLLILVAGVLLIAPGVLTDLTGFALLIPPVRRLVRNRLSESLRARFVHFGPGRHPDLEPGSRIIDVQPVDRERQQDADR
jgi:UPF0716 protein FxsA